MIECQAEVINSLDDLQRLTLKSKVGFDGSSGRSLYTQITTEKENRNITDKASLFLTCFVPLQLFGYSNGEKRIIWSNPHPSSALFSRPIRFSYKKEKDVLKEEEEFLRNSTEKLFTTNYEKFTVLHKFELQ